MLPVLESLLLVSFLEKKDLLTPGLWPLKKHLCHARWPERKAECA
jgi:hypothetical protein